MKNKKGGFKLLLKRLMVYVKPHRSIFWLSVLMDVIAVILNMLIPIFTARAIDGMITIGNVDFRQIYYCSVVIVLLTSFNSFFDWFGTHLMNVMTYKTNHSMRLSIYGKLNTVPIKFIDNTPHGDIMNTMINDVENITDGFLEGFKMVILGILQIVTSVVIMFIMKWSLAILVVVLGPMTLLFAILIAKKSKKFYQEKVEKQGEISGYVEEMVTNMKITKAFNSEESVIEGFEKYNNELYSVNEKSMFCASLANPTSRLLDGLLYGIVGVTGAIMTMYGGLGVGQISAFLNYSDKYTDPINDITGIFADLNVAIASMHRVFDLIEQEDEISDKDLPIMKKCNGEVSLKNVDFSYSDSFKLIENLNLEVKQGERIAIVGPTGCGKSTLINLLMRFYDVKSGSIKVSGKDIRKVQRHSFRQFYGMVLQESWLYNASIKDNVAYAKPDASMDEIIEACKLANAHTFIEKMPNGYDTIISERGDNISAGQKQLLCIARIMLLKPPMMILDEATSNIDTRTEMKIQQALDVMMKGRTCFIVAHRLSTIENADMILVMNKGRVVEQGTHKELLKKQGFYYELFNSQFGG